MTELSLVKPSSAELPPYVAALERGWSPDNVILACGGVLHDRFRKPAVYGDVVGLRCRIDVSNVRA